MFIESHYQNLFTVHIRDPNNIPHTIKNLKITMRDMNMQLPQAVTARKMMNDVVANTQPQLTEGGRGNVVTFGSYDLQLSGIWEKLMLLKEHEFEEIVGYDRT